MTHQKTPLNKAPTFSLTLTRAQYAVLRGEFPEGEWSISEALRCCVRDYFEARGVEFPPDANGIGGWKTRRNRPGHV